MLPETLFECIKHDGIVAIATCSPEHKAHVINTWNKYLIVTEDEKILMPAFGMVHTAKNVEQDPYMEVTIGSHEVQGKMGMGTGFLLIGTGEFKNEGELFDRMKAKCDFARKVLIFTPEKCRQTV